MGLFLVSFWSKDRATDNVVQLHQRNEIDLVSKFDRQHFPLRSDFARDSVYKKTNSVSDWYGCEYTEVYTR